MNAATIENNSPATIQKETAKTGENPTLVKAVRERISQDLGIDSRQEDLSYRTFIEIMRHAIDESARIRKLSDQAPPEKVQAYDDMRKEIAGAYLNAAQSPLSLRPALSQAIFACDQRAAEQTVLLHQWLHNEQVTEVFSDRRNPAAKEAADCLFRQTALGAVRLMKSPLRQRTNAIAREMFAAAAQQVKKEERSDETIAASLYCAGMLQREAEMQGKKLDFHPTARFLIDRTMERVRKTGAKKWSLESAEQTAAELTNAVRCQNRLQEG